MSYGTVQTQNLSLASKTGTKAGLIVGGGGGLLFLTTMFGSWYTIDQTQRGALLRNGAFIGAVQPGLHFKLPWVEDIYKIDMQTHTKAWDKMEAYSSDQQPAHLKVSVTLHVEPDRVADMYSRFRGDVDAGIARIIQPHVFEKVKVVFGQYTAAKAISERAKLNSDAAAALTQAIAYDPVFGIESVQIENIEFSPDYIKSVEQRMQAEVEVQRYRQQLEREKIQADIAFTQADGRARAIRTEAQAQADAIKLRGEAEATSIEARGKALKSSPEVVELTKADKWNGALPTTMIPSGAVPFMSVK